MKYLIHAAKFVSIDWIFKLKNIRQGKIVQKYNIITMHLENYFIPPTQLEGFELARAKQDMNAFKKFGKLIKS